MAINRIHIAIGVALLSSHAFWYTVHQVIYQSDYYVKVGHWENYVDEGSGGMRYARVVIPPGVVQKYRMRVNRTALLPIYEAELGPDSIEISLGLEEADPFRTRSTGNYQDADLLRVRYVKGYAEFRIKNLADKSQRFRIAFPGANFIYGDHATYPGYQKGLCQPTFLNNVIKKSTHCASPITPADDRKTLVDVYMNIAKWALITAALAFGALAIYLPWRRTYWAQLSSA